MSASGFRPDLLAAGVGDGRHAFSFPVPPRLKDGLPHLLDVRFAADGSSLISSPHSLTCTGPEGVDDTATCSYLAGWAWDRSTPSSTVGVDLFQGDSLLATVLANGYRPDLAAAGIGNGYHAYFYQVPPLWKDGKPRTITARVAGTAVTLTNTGKTLTCAGLEGVDDTSSCSYFAGWAWDRSNPAATVSVDIFDGATLIATLSANGYRPDLQSAGIGNGRHAYYYATPQTLKDGRPHVISVRVNQTNVNLSGTGRTIACAAQ